MKPTRHWRRWTTREDDRLRMLWGLRATRKAIAHSVSRPDVPATRHFHIVDPIDVDDAIAEWCRQETIEEAATRHGLTGDTVRRLMLAAGHKPPRMKKRRWRIDSAVVDQVVAAYRARVALPSVSEHARRVGVHRTTLASKLRTAGVLGEKRSGAGGLVRLPVEVVDRIVGGRAA